MGILLFAGYRCQSVYTNHILAQAVARKFSLRLRGKNLHSKFIYGKISSTFFLMFWNLRQTKRVIAPSLLLAPCVSYWSFTFVENV